MNARPLLSHLAQVDEQGRRQALLNTLLRIVWIVGVLSLALPVAFPELKIPLLINSTGFIVAPIVLWLIGKRISINTSSLIFIIVAMSLVAVSRGQLPRDAAIVLSSAFVIIVAGTGLLLGRGGIRLAVGASVLSTWADTLLRLTSVGFNDSLLVLSTCIYTILFVVCGLFMEIFSRTIETALDDMRSKERILAQRNADLEHEVTVRGHVEAQLLHLTGGLQMVLDATNELLACATQDELWRHAVEMARERLGVDRCAIFLLAEDGLTMQGTFGTDMNGCTTDEHALSFNISDSDWASELKEWKTNNTRNYWAIQHDSSTTEWRDGEHRIVGRGWITWTPLRARDGRRMGVFFNDAQRTGAAPNSSLQDTIAIYCAQISIIAEAKKN